MKKWECYRCGHVVEADDPPEECPACRYSLTFWLEWEEAKSSLDAPVSQFMQEAVTAGPVEMIFEVARRMRERRTTCVVVVDGGKAMGIVTEKDMVNKVLAGAMDPTSVTIHKVMSSPVVTIDAREPARRALEAMKLNGFRRLLVTEGQKTVGMVTQESILGGAMGVGTKGGPKS